MAGVRTLTVPYPDTIEVSIEDGTCPTCNGFLLHEDGHGGLARCQDCVDGQSGPFVRLRFLKSWDSAEGETEGVTALEVTITPDQAELLKDFL